MSHKWKTRVFSLLLALPGALLAIWALIATAGALYSLFVLYNNQPLSRHGKLLATAFVIGLVSSASGWVLGPRFPRFTIGVYVFSLSGGLSGLLVFLAIALVVDLDYTGPPPGYAGMFIGLFVLPVVVVASLAGGTIGLLSYYARSRRGTGATNLRPEPDARD
ncbi:hypothetical protein [Tautonia plasticadhaerens]|uniref:hypothetical protein n=1 Tax=Tautonia plasticadhaerens TaxID=2527974 RepID=UPI00119EFDCF|nr:hypothetical protein [Tautonia plasticadhaerens]